MNNPYELVKNILQSDTTNDGSLSSPDTFASIDLYGASVRRKEEVITSATASISRTRAAAGISHSTAYFPASNWSTTTCT